MRAWAGLALSLSIAGCGYNPAGPEVSIDPRCRDAVFADPKVSELIANSAGSPDNFALIHKRDLADAKADANLRCLRARGLIQGGGVERYGAPVSARPF